MLATCYISIQSYFKIDFILTMLSMFTLYIKSHEPFVSLRKNCLELDKNKSIVSTFSVFVVYKAAVTTIIKSNYVGCFNLRQWMFVFGHLFPDISPNCTSRAGEKISLPISALFFHNMTDKVSRNNCIKRHKDWTFPWYILDSSKLAGSKLTRFCVYLHFSISPYQTLMFGRGCV